MEVKQHKHQKKKLGSFPYFSVVFSITLALFVIGLFGLLLLHTTTLTDTIRENISMQVYLDKYINETDRIKLTRMLSARPFVAQNEDGPQVTYISRDEAARIFIQDTDEDFTEFLGDNPLRDAFNIKIAAGHQHVDSLKRIKSYISRLDGVFEVVYMENLVRTINENLAKVALILLSLAVILFITIIVLINNTIKLALFSQRFLIRSMQLIGAKPGFITAPFVRRSAVHGLLAGIIAVGMLYGLMKYANTRIEELQSLQNEEHLFILLGILVILGMLIATVSTYNAVRKYLKMSLDELY